MKERDLFNGFGWFSRELPDMMEPMMGALVQLVHVGATESMLRRSLDKICKMDWVAVPEGYVEDSIASAYGDYGRFRVYVQTQYLDEVVDALTDMDPVLRVHAHQWYAIKRHDLKEIFPDSYQDTFFCEACDEKKKDEFSPCENGGCRMGLRNFSEVQANAAALQQQLEELNAQQVASGGEVVIAAVPKYVASCDDCDDGWSGTFDRADFDCDDDVQCECGNYIHISECEVTHE